MVIEMQMIVKEPRKGEIIVARRNVIIVTPAT